MCNELFPVILTLECTSCNVDFIILSKTKHLSAHLEASNRQQDVLFGNSKSGADDGFEISFTSIFSKAGYFPRTGHLHPQQYVCSM
jgi:hypothetical protein